MNDTTDPFSVGLGKAAVRMDGHDFIGKPALAALSGRPRERKLVGFEMTEPAVPRQGYPIMVSGRGIGAVSTGLFGPSTARYVGMGYVESAYAGIGQRIDIVIRGVPKAARVVERPFYRSPHWSLTKGGRA
jgi:aminomethyltransferase